MNIKRNVLAAAFAAIVLAGCGANGNSPAPPTGVAAINNNVLQFAVGTVNLYGTAKGINFVVTYRQPSNGYAPGDSGALVSTPSLHVPFSIMVPRGSAVSYDGTSTAWTGPSGREHGSHHITATSQADNASSLTTFGQSGGAFGIGIEPFNLYGPADAPYPGLINSPFQVAPYPVPLYSRALPNGANVNIFEPWGGPPAFDLLGNGHSPVGSSQVPTGQAGLSMGLDIFALDPVSGSYGITVVIPTSKGNFAQNASANMNAGKMLPTVKKAPSFFADGSGGGKMTVKMPAGATEEYVQVTDPGSGTSSSGCNTAGGSASTVIYYTMVAHGSGTVTLPSHAGPNGTQSLCGGDHFTVQVIAFDYPMYEASYPKSLHNPKPPIRGHNDQDDVTISPAACYVAPAGQGLAPAC